MGCHCPSPPTPRRGALPAALAYRWSAGGTLLPEGVLSQDRVPPVPPFAPVGNPDGDAAFTLWQPGELAPASAPPTLYAFGPNISAWSPDGRYIIVGLNLGGILVPVGQPLPNRQGLDLQHYGTLPFVPIRDVALQVASQYLSWRPDGRVLAAYGSEASGTAMVLYDCATGRRLATLPLPQTPVSLLGIEAAVRWSPDGSRLVLSSAQWGPVVLWGPDQLPH
jgi:WD40 repeat protein